MNIKANKSIKIDIPVDVQKIIQAFSNSGYNAFIVGGCVRDSLLERNINDWDLCTNALPEQIINICEKYGFKYIPTGLKHGTVTIMINNEGYEITTFRIDGDYSDNRHPDNVDFTSSLEEDLSRRDFTINALAYNHEVGLVDYFDGINDLKNNIIRCVGNAQTRLNEDNLRRLRAIRFACQLGFEIDSSTYDALSQNTQNLTLLSVERIREELNKILISNNPAYGIKELYKLNMLKYIVPELEFCANFNQHNKHHDKDVFEHILSVVANSPCKLDLRLAALLHDIGKPRCYTEGEDGQGHFIGHHIISADMAREILVRLKYDNKTIDKVCVLVYEHMSRYDKLRTPNIKKFINRVGPDNLNDLFELQVADIRGCAEEYQDLTNVIKLKKECDRILNEKQPLTLKDLSISGRDLISLGITQGKEIGLILNELLNMVLEDPSINEKDKLLEITKSIKNML